MTIHIHLRKWIQASLLAFLACMSLSVAANPCDDGGIGGTGISLGRGIGGTGITNNQVNASKGIGGTGITSTQKGIGGTGAQTQNGIGGTGIVGVITGFGSICVNGLEVHYYDDTPVDADGKKISSQQLAIGQVVAVRATGSDTLIASEIHAYHQISGPITAIDNKNGKIKVMGQSVSAKPADVKALKIGQWVAVSGLRETTGNVLATRIDRTTSQNEVHIVGNVMQRGNNNYIGETKVVGLNKVANNQNAESRLSGVWDGSKVVAKVVSIGPVRELLSKVDTFHLQGIVGENVVDGQLRLAKQNITISDKTKLVGENNPKNLIGKTVIVRGYVRNAEPIAHSIELLHTKADYRQQDDNQHARGGRHTDEHHNSDENHSTPPDANNSEPQTPEKAESHNDLEKAEQLERVEENEKVEKPEAVEKIETVEKPETVEKIEKPETVEKIEKPETVEKIEKPETVEKIEKPETVEKIEKPETVEKIEKPETVEKIEKPETVEKIEKPETVEKIEKPETVEKDD